MVERLSGKTKRHGKIRALRRAAHRIGVNDQALDRSTGSSAAARSAMSRSRPPGSRRYTRDPPDVGHRVDHLFGDPSRHL
jgi:hypothetical protein